MRTALNILGMFRWANLLMMAAALALTRYCIFLTVYRAAGVPLQAGFLEFLLLLFATLLIAAGGYVVNDILDTGLDELNKPGKNIVGDRISEKTAWTLYYSLSAAGILAGALLAWLAGKAELGILFLVVATSLYYYSLKYKYLAFWGNFTVALLTALAVAIYWLFEFFFLKKAPEQFIPVSTYFGLINRLVAACAAFAFLTTMIREIIKDAQDLDGDARFGCRTIPIVLGIKNTHLLLILLLAILVILLILVQVYIFNSFMILALFLTLPLLMSAGTAVYLIRSKNKADYRRLSLLMKLVMAAGLLSMVFLWFPN